MRKTVMVDDSRFGRGERAVTNTSDAKKQSECVWKAVALQLAVCIVLILLVLWGANFKDGTGLRFTHFGPATKDVPISVMGVHIDSWSKWTILIVALILLEVTQTWTHKIYKRWYRYSVRAKGESGMSKQSTIFLASVWKICTWFPSIFKFLLVVATQQLQFLLPTLIGRITMSNIVDYNTLIE